MKSVRLHDDGLRLEEIPRPEPGTDEVLVRVHAAAITRDELTWPTDRLPAIPSYELSGVVESTGEEVIALTPFDRDGVAAEWASVPRSVLAPKPAGLSHAEAAALPMPGLTAWQGLVVHGALSAGQRILARPATCCSTLSAVSRWPGMPAAPDPSSRSRPRRPAPTSSSWNRMALSSRSCRSCARRSILCSPWRTSRRLSRVSPSEASAARSS